MNERKDVQEKHRFCLSSLEHLEQKNPYYETIPLVWKILYRKINSQTPKLTGSS